MTLPFEAEYLANMRTSCPPWVPWYPVMTTPGAPGALLSMTSAAPLQLFRVVSRAAHRFTPPGP